MMTRRWLVVIGSLAVVIAAIGPVWTADDRGLEQVAQAVEKAAEAAGARAQEAAAKAIAAAEGQEGQFETEGGDVINRNGDVTIAADKTVKGDVVAVNGTAHIRGKVNGNVVAVKGSIHVYDGAEVKGDAVALGGQLVRDPQAKVGGSKLQLSAKWAEMMTGKALKPEGELKVGEGEAGGALQVATEDQIVRFGGPVVVKEDEEVKGDVVALGGPVEIKGHVKGDTVSIGGPIDVSGKVDGDAVAVGGPMHLQSSAEIKGDAVTVGGPLRKEPGATIHGTTSSTNVFPGLVGSQMRPTWMLGTLGRIGVWVLTTLTALVIAVLVVVLFPRQTEVVATQIAAEPGRVFGYGVVGWLLMLPALILTAVTCVLLPLFLLLVAAMAILGAVGVKLALGRQLAQSMRWQASSLLALAVIGTLALRVADLASLLPLGGVVAVVITMGVLVFGLGGALMTRLGTDPTGTWVSHRMSGSVPTVVNPMPGPAWVPSPAPAAPMPVTVEVEPLTPEVQEALDEVARADAGPPAPPTDGAAVPEGPPPTGPSTG